MAWFISQRSSKWSFWTDTLGGGRFALAPFPKGTLETVGADWVVPIEVVEALSSSLSVSIRGKGGGISGAPSRKSQGSSSSPVWSAPKNAVRRSQNLFVSLPAKAMVKLCRASHRRRFARDSSSALTRSKCIA